MAFSGNCELMSRTLSSPFFSATPVFTRADYARAVGRAPADKTVTAMLSQHVKAGNIKRIARGLYASVPKHADAATWWVDRFLLASRLRPEAVIGYHSALELHGYAYTAEFDVQAIAPGEPGLFKTKEFSCRFVRPTTPLGPESITTVDRLGQAVAVTTLERTVADLFDRPDLAGGAEEVLKSLDLVRYLDPAKVVDYIELLDNRSLASVSGWWLEKRRAALGVADDVLARLRTRLPRSKHYALGAEPGHAVLVEPWRVLLPTQAVDAAFEGV